MPEPHSTAARLLGERVRQRRLELTISQEDVGVLAGMHVTNLGKIERGLVNPSLSTIVCVATALDIDPASLVAGLSAEMLPNRPHMLTAAALLRERDNRAGRP